MSFTKNQMDNTSMYGAIEGETKQVSKCKMTSKMGKLGNRFVGLRK
jgi:hypothetical protein